MREPSLCERQTELATEAWYLEEQMTPQALRLFQRSSRQPGQQLLVERACVAEGIDEQLSNARSFARAHISWALFEVHRWGGEPELLDMTDLDIGTATHRLELEVQIAVLCRGSMKQWSEQQSASDSW